MILDAELKIGIQEMELIGFINKLFSNPGKACGLIEGIKIKEFVLLFLQFVLEFMFVLKIDVEDLGTHGTTPLFRQLPR